MSKLGPDALVCRSFLLADGRAEGTQLEAEVGWRTGLLAAIFCAAQFVTSFPLGALSDRVGRKPMMVLSHASGAATIVAFGLSGNYAAALGSRIVGGLLNVTGG